LTTIPWGRALRSNRGLYNGTNNYSQVGAGLQITPNSSKLLTRWGLPESLWKSIAKPDALNIRRYSDGKILFREQDYGEYIEQRYGSAFIDIHRVDLQSALFNRAKDLGVQFKFGCKIIDVDMDEARVTSLSGDVFEGDLIIGADGLWSRCREILLGNHDKPNPTGDIAYRITLNAKDIPVGELRDRVTKPALNIWFGPDGHAVSYSIRNGTMLNIVLMVPDDLPSDVSKQSGSIEEMRKLFSTWDPMSVYFPTRRFYGLT
jgi:salicylate hydroxylase